MVRGSQRPVKCDISIDPGINSHVGLDVQETKKKTTDTAKFAKESLFQLHEAVFGGDKLKFAVSMQRQMPMLLSVFLAFTP